MNIRDAVQRFSDFMIETHKGKMQNNGWMSIRGEMLCKECASHKRSTLYILILEDAPVFLNCFRAGCTTKRVCSAEDYKAFGFTDIVATNVLLRNSARGKFTYKDLEVKKDLIIRSTFLSTAQEDYFYKRCNFVPTQSDIKKFRIVPNIYQLMQDNFISKDGTCPKSKNDFAIVNNYFRVFGKENTTEYITYFTNDMGKFYFRSIEKDSYVSKGQLSRSENKSYYFLKRGHDAKSIVLAEGFFDIINIYKYFCVDDNMVYSCTGGFAAFENHILEFYKRNITSVEDLILFCDSDKIDKYSKKPTLDLVAIHNMLKRVFKKLDINTFKNIYIIYNTASKDFGDMSLPIKAVKTRVVLSSILEKKLKLVPL